MCQKLAKDKPLKLQLQINQNLTKIYYAYIKTLFICIVYTSTGYKSEINVHNKFCLPKSKYSVFCFQSCVMYIVEKNNFNKHEGECKQTIRY